MTATIDLFDPDAYVAGPPHAQFEELRLTQPVSWQETPFGHGYWAILKHADIRQVASQPKLFSSHERGVQIETPPPDQLAISRGMLTQMDPPQHAGHRAPVMGSFTPKTIARLGGRIREITRTILADAAQRCEENGQVEFVHEVCSHLPTRVFGELAGLPREDWEYMHDLAARLTQSQDPEIVEDENDKRAAGPEMARYAIDFGARRRYEPARDDLTSLMLDAEFSGRPLTGVEFGLYFCQFIVAANETTVTLLSSGLLALLEHPDQLALVRADPSLIPGAIEEILRWANPLHYLARTAMADTELRGVQVKAGDKLAMYYTSGNRDEEVFRSPHDFDIRRSPNPHVSFGYADHFCIGAHLARLEGKIFFQELLAAFPHIEAIGTPRRLRSNFNNALKEFQVSLR